MSQIEILAKKFEAHISLPWQRNLSPSERVIFVVYPKEKEQRLRFQKGLFQQAVIKAKHGWHSICLDNAFPEWMSQQDYREDYFDHPEDLQQKLERDFPNFVWQKVNHKMKCISNDDVLALFGVGSLFGLARASAALKRLEIRGRLVVFFPGTREKNVYRLLDARDGWDYLAFPITLNEDAYQ